MDSCRRECRASFRGAGNDLNPEQSWGVGVKKGGGGGGEKTTTGAREERGAASAVGDVRSGRDCGGR